MADDLQFEYNSLLLGENTPYQITSIEGLDPPDARVDEVARTIQHGSFTFAEFLESRNVMLKGFVADNDQAAFQTLLNDFKRAFVPVNNDIRLQFKWPGMPEMFVLAKSRRATHSINLDYTLGFSEWACNLIAGDPRLYSMESSTLVGGGVATNIGIFPSPPVLNVTSYTNLVATNVTTGRSLSLTGSGVDLEIDFAARTIKEAGVSKYDKLNDAAEWWEIDPGDNTIAYSGVTGSATLTWRSAWI